MASLHLQQITERTYLIPSPANIGVYVNDHRAILIDSGMIQTPVGRFSNC